jgi:hypothetical protein
MTEEKREADLAEHVNTEFEKYQETGNGLYLLQAIQACGLYRLPIPFSVRTAFGDALRRYSDGEAWTLDEAFQVNRPKGAHQPTWVAKHRNNGSGYSRAYSIWRRVHELYTPGKKPSKATVFADLADIYGLSAGTVENYFNEVEEVISQDKKS